MTLLEFIERTDDLNVWPRNDYVFYPGFHVLYVRRPRQRQIDGFKVLLPLDLASTAAKRPGKGAFTRMVKDLRERYPGLVLYVECVQNPRFAEKLERDGWRRVMQLAPHQFDYWLPA